MSTAVTLAAPALAQVEGETALVGEAVEHPQAFREAPRPAGMAFQLVEVEAGLLAVEHVDLELDAVGIATVKAAGFRTLEHPDLLLEPLGAQHRRIISQHDRFRRDQVAQGAGDPSSSRWCMARVRVWTTMMRAVAVDDQPRDAVGLAPDESTEGVVDPEAATQLDRLFDPAVERSR